MPTEKNSPSGRSIDLGQVITIAVENRNLIERIVNVLAGLFRRKPQPTPGVPITKPQPAPGSDPSDDFPDDTIPTPAPSAPTVARVDIKLARVQYQKSRFPEKYTEANPHGLVDDDTKGKIQRGEQAMNWGSKFWLDLTAYDPQGREYTRDRVIASGLAYSTEHHCGGAFIKGHGVDKNGEPAAGYETNDTDQIGNGDSAWRSSLGFLHQMKSHADSNGRVYEVYGVVAGVKSNVFRIKIS